MLKEMGVPDNFIYKEIIKVKKIISVSSVQSLSRVQLFVTR